MLADHLRGAGIVQAADGDEAVHGCLDPRTQGRAILATPAEAINLEARTVEQLEQFNSQQRNGMQAKVRREEANAHSLMLVARARRQLRHPLIDPLTDEALRGGKLQTRVIRGRKHSQRRGGLEHGAQRQASDLGESGPLALLLAQVHPVLNHLGLFRVGLQAGQQLELGLIELADFLHQPAHAVEYHQVKLAVQLGANQGMIEHRLPDGQSVIRPTLALDHRTQVEPGLDEVRLAQDGSPVSLLGRRQLLQLGQRHPQIELDDVVGCRLAVRQPGLVQPDHIQRPPCRRQALGDADQLHGFKAGLFGLLEGVVQEGIKIQGCGNNFRHAGALTG